jgi:hypothetical protein
MIVKQAKKQIRVRKMIVSCVELNTPDIQSTFECFEFPNGSIAVLGEISNDWYFEKAEDIQANGNTVVTEIEKTEEFHYWEAFSVAESLAGSTVEFGYDAGIKAAWLAVKESLRNQNAVR